jgi:RNA polymerase sigma factor (sigma-70 family)
VSSRNVVTISTEAELRFNDPFQRHHADVFRYCIRRVDRADAEDTVAEVFAVAWRRLDQVPDNDMAKAWLLAVAHRVVGNQYRGKARRGRLSARLSGLAPESREAADVTIIRREEEDALLRALDSLRMGDRELLRLVSWDGLSHREIAETLGINEDAVSKRLSRAQARLRDRYDQIYPVSPSSPSTEAST